jgi:hypothetical protein
LAVDAVMENYFSGFHSLYESPIYILTEENEGILINPTNDQLINSVPIYNNIVPYDKLRLYRNETIKDLAKVLLINQRFYSFAEIDGKFMLFYDISQPPPNDFYYNYKNRNGEFHVAVFYHELFHVYSSMTNYDFFLGGYWTQETNRYPFNEDTLPLLILLFKVMEDAYHLQNYEEKLSSLKYYVSINKKLNSVDPTPDNLIRHHGFSQEKLEGAARYVEVFSTLEALNNDTTEDPTHGYGDFADAMATRDRVRTVYARRIFYHVGAGAIHLLKELEYPNFEEQMFIPTNTIFDIADDFLNLSPSEMDIILNEAKLQYDWPAIVARADFLLNL